MPKISVTKILFFLVPTVLLFISQKTIAYYAPTSSYDPCSVPETGDWTISSSCTLETSDTLEGDLTVNNGCVLEIENGVTLTVDLEHSYIRVISGGGILIRQGGTITQSTPRPTQENFKVAFIGDSDAGFNFESVLNLIKNENADMVLHQGDFDNTDSKDPAVFETIINNILGVNFPYFGSVGNHDNNDAGEWNAYANQFLTRMQRLGLTPDFNDLTDQKYSLTYKGLKMVFVGENGNNTEFANFINSEFATDDHIWKICSWHQMQNAMQVGSKADDMGWDVYENCRTHGAIIVNGHEHSYHRTKTLTDMSDQTVDVGCSDPNNLCVGNGKTFSNVSGLGGIGIRNQDRCLPISYPYGCNGEWASIYTTDQSAQYGALFIEFRVDGDTEKASGYFKNIDGVVVDTFTIIKQ
ncbi:hypothetical protein A2X44_04650 [candidate division CPR3 bacterium GWF2_35_18]|nr:MAG: hypothetical protein A2X44_04650 [candidate division CPR3 bacterium GWF2_35_18]OGB64181.1 MAG: hypothetical protein A2250_02595 [candidate division CPR3 bacterium RIFOXYA2_FULL_35_13]OGB76806.1 MAG: hypothetical protein A2476_04980 [candidate division CPR3 bacterium RIFOXYC2_FULL_35_7]OGB78384.1 MAG: hypothetical protein A2296_02790 [candidate division CPR3 bacterium RIFOXYB2_FULL_35_8]